LQFVVPVGHQHWLLVHTAPPLQSKVLQHPEMHWPLHGV
jgi:hypothetical protein